MLCEFPLFLTAVDSTLLYFTPVLLDSRWNAQVNSYSEHELGRIFREYGEDWRRWRVDARAVVAARQQSPITTTFGLLRALGHDPESGGGVKRKGGAGGRCFGCL